MSAFRVGEIAVGQGFVHSAYRNGMECEVIGPLEPRTTKCTSNGQITTALRYKVRWADGDITCQEAHYLRKKQPPKREIDTVVSWSDCAWQPSRVPA